MQTERIMTNPGVVPKANRTKGFKNPPRPSTSPSSLLAPPSPFGSGAMQQASSSTRRDWPKLPSFSSAMPIAPRSSTSSDVAPVRASKPPTTERRFLSRRSRSNSTEVDGADNVYASSPATFKAPLSASAPTASFFTPPPPIATPLTGESSTSAGMSISGDPRQEANHRAMKSLRDRKAGKERGYFVTKRGGRRHHAFPKSECPYPMACDRDALDLDIHDLNHLLLVTGSGSLIDCKDRQTPKRVLDLGCGNGTWIMAMGKEWKDCHFVGFDVVPVHVNLQISAPEVADRVQWVYGNFLTRPLPFEAASFDYVHVKSIARGVPENKWDFIMEEISRVLVPGGAIEIIEEDIIFPFIEPQNSRKRKKSEAPDLATPVTPWRLPPPTPFLDRLAPLLPRREFSPDGTQTASQPSSFSLSSQERESTSSFSSAHSSSHGLTQGRSPSPPPPLPPPKEFGWHYSPSLEFLRRGSIVPDPARRGSDAAELPRRSSVAPEGLRRGSLASLVTKALPPTPVPTEPYIHVSPHGVRVAEQQRLKSSRDEYKQLERLFHNVFESRFINMQPTRLIPNLLNIYFTKASASPYITRYMPPRRRKGRRISAFRVSADRPGFGVFQPLQHRPSISSIVQQDENLEDGTGLAPISSLEHAQETRRLLTTHLTVAVHLHRTLKGVLACKEAMWEELMLSKGWGAHTNPDILRRERSDFDKLVDRYRIAAQARISLDEAIERGLGWHAPKKDPSLAKLQREVLGEVQAIDGEQSSDDEDETADDDMDKEDSDDERTSGQAFRKVRMFYAFKPGP